MHEASTATQRMPSAGNRHPVGASEMRYRVLSIALEIAAVVAITAVGGLLRFNGLEYAPPGVYHDESIYGVLGAYVYHGNREIYFGEREGLYMYLLAAGMRLLGHDVLTLRIVSATLGTATIPLLYLLARLTFGRRVAILAAAGLTASFWHVSLSRTIFRAMTLPLFETLAFATLWTAIRARAPLLRFPLALLAGAALGLTLYTYIAARMLPVVVATFAVSEVIVRRKISVSAVAAALYTAGAVIVFWPLGALMLDRPEMALGRMGEVAVAGSNSGIGLYAENALRVAGMFFVAGDQNWRHNLAGKPVLDPLFGLAFLLGLAICFRRWRAPESRFLLLWLAAMLVPTLAAVDAPHFLRADGALPAIYLVVAVGFAGAYDGLTSRVKPLPSTKRSLAFAALVAVLVAYPSLATWQTYFEDWLRRPATYLAFDGPHSSAANYMAESPQWRDSARGKEDFFVTARFWQDRTAMMYRLWPWISGRDRDALGETRLGSRWWDEGRALPLRDGGAIFLVADGDSWAATELRRLYGTALVEEKGTAPGYEITPFVVLKAPPQKTVLAGPPLADFGGAIALRDYRLPASVASGDVVEVATQWTVDQVPPAWLEPGRAPSVFVHILDVDGTVLVGADGLGFDPADWRAGEGFVLRHTLRLPTGTAPGNYQVLLGVSESDGRRVTHSQSSEGVVKLGAEIKVASNTQPPAAEVPAGLNFDVGGTLRLLGAKLRSQEAIGPGDTVRADLYWLALAAIPEDYTVEVTLNGPDGAESARATGKPAAGRYPTSLWQAGEVVRDPRALTLSARAQAGDHTLNVAVVDAAGRRHGQVIAARLQVRTPQRAYSPPPSMTGIAPAANYARIAGLLGYETTSAPAKPGGTLKVTLYWKCLGETEERFKVFVHLVGPAGLVAQSDVQPAANTRPTTGWVKDEVVADTHSLPLPANLAPGEYAFQVGLYDPRDGRRLPLIDGDGREGGTFTVLDSIAVN